MLSAVYTKDQFHFYYNKCKNLNLSINEDLRDYVRRLDNLICKTEIYWNNGNIISEVQRFEFFLNGLPQSLQQFIIEENIYDIEMSLERMPSRKQKR